MHGRVLGSVGYYKEVSTVLTRRQLMTRGAVGGAGLMVPRALFRAGGAFATTSVAGSLKPYVDAMPLLVDNAIIATAPGAAANISTAVITRKLHRDLPPTTLFGYLQPGGPGTGTAGASYLGPAIVAKAGVPLTVNYSNGLASDDYLRVFTNGGSSYTQQIDPDDQGISGVRILTHLHGGFVAGADDGNPFASPAVAPGGTQSVSYPNEQPASLLWYHDHYEGDTRMNVVAGLAAGYLLRDDVDTGSNSLLSGPLGTYELPLVVQDRQFDALGALLYPVAPASMNGPWIGEYFGDCMLVNGKIWPDLVVEPAVYRFRVLNGCNSRILNLNLGKVPMYIIGAEGGLLPDGPVPTDKLVMAPAERFDVLVDFRKYAGQTVHMGNNNPSAPVKTPAPPLSQVMRFRVKGGTPSGAIPARGWLPLEYPQYPLLGDLKALADLGAPALSGGAVKCRMFTLNEIGAGTDKWKLNINAAPFGDSEALVETLKWKAVEDWYYVNFTADTHPMHTHLFTFKVIGRYRFDAAGYAAKYGDADGVPQETDPQQVVLKLKPFLKSGLLPPDPGESGFKDTVKANPGQITVVRAQFNLPSSALTSDGNLVNSQKYVHHCHIVEHEDNDMMERFVVIP